MSDTYREHHKYGGPHTQGTYKNNPKEAMYRIRKLHPDSTQKERVAIFTREALADIELNLASLEYTAINHDNQWTRLEERDEVAVKLNERTGRVVVDKTKKKKIREQRMQQRRATQERNVELVREAVATKFLDFPMPNGKKLRDCTFGYVAEQGAAFTALSKLGKPDQIVGQVLSDEAANAVFR